MGGVGAGASNRGAAGVDRVTLAVVEAYGVDRMLAELARDLRRGRTVRRRCGGWRSPSRTAAGGRWVFRRPLRSAGASSQDSDCVVVTHPFHPLCGQSLPVLFSRRRGGDVVFVCTGGVLGRVTVPRSWTDRGDPRSTDRLEFGVVVCVGHTGQVAGTAVMSSLILCVWIAQDDEASSTCRCGHCGPDGGGWPRVSPMWRRCCADGWSGRAGGAGSPGASARAASCTAHIRI